MRVARLLLRFSRGRSVIFNPVNSAFLRIAAASALVGLALAAAPASAGVRLRINIGSPQPYVQAVPAPRHGYQAVYQRTPDRWDNLHGVRGAPRYLEHGYDGRTYPGGYGYGRPGYLSRGGYAQP
jgi:hypothetical protein